MCLIVIHHPSVSDKKKFKSMKGAQKAVSDSLVLNPQLDISKVRIKDSHTLVEYPV